MNLKREKRKFRIDDNAAGDERFPFVLIDETDTIVRVGTKPSTLAALGFDLGADEVEHAYHYAGIS